MKKLFLNKIVKHWHIIIFALFFGFLIIWPTIFSIYRIGFKNFHGIYPMFSKDETYYLAKGEEIYSRSDGLGNAYLKEYKNQPYVNSLLAEWLFAHIAKLSHVSVPFLYAINDFVFPVLGVVLLYILILNITKSKKIAFLFSLIFSLLFIREFGRPINPQFSIIWLISGLILIWEIYSQNLKLKRTILYNVLLGTIIAILFYIYPYYWTALALIYGLCIFARAIFKKSFKYFALNASSFSIAVFAFTIPYLLNLIKAVNSPFYAETLARVGMLNNNHWPACYFNVALAALLLIAVILTKKIFYNYWEFHFIIILQISAIILNWQNVITGKYMLFSSHYYPVTVLLLVISMSVFILNIIRARKEFNKISFLKIILSLLIVIVVFGLVSKRQINTVKQALSANVSLEEMNSMQKTAQLFDWLNQNTPKNSVLYIIDDKYGWLYPEYIHNNVYFDGYAGCFLMSDDEVEDRWVRQNIFNDKIDIKFITDHQRNIWLQKFVDFYQNRMIRNKIINLVTAKKKTLSEEIPAAYPERVFDKYNSIKKEDREKVLKKYEIDYIVFYNNGDDKLANELKNLSFIHLVARIDNRNIYRVD